MNLLARLRCALNLAPQAWALAAPYFRSERRWIAGGLLLAIVALNLAAVYMLVQINSWNRLFYDALQQRNTSVFWQQLGHFAWLALGYVVIAVYRFYLTQRLTIDWRRWLTERMLARWLAGKAFYRLELVRFRDGEQGAAALPDNPDQRIQEDLNLFTGASVGLSMGLLNAVVTLASFVGILWVVWFTSFFGQAAVVFPFIIAAPRFLSGAIQLGELMQIASAFDRVQGSLSWLVDNYADLAAWRATTERLSGFEASLADPSGAVGLQPEPAARLSARDLSVALPDGRPLLTRATLSVTVGQTVLISGPSGAGKSTLLRALAGIWPWAQGSVHLPRDAMFIPQKPYFPDGPLRDALAYPERASRYGEAELRRALFEAELPALCQRLDEAGAWNARLSGGEQQRLAIARVLLKRPAWVFADEATSALDSRTEDLLYQRLRDIVRGRGALVSIAHKSSLERFHATRWRLDPQQAQIRAESMEAATAA